MTSLCYYTCHLLPATFLARTGCRPTRLPSADTGVAHGHGDVSVHSTTCPYVVALVAAAEKALTEESRSSLVVPAGCDAMRRVGEVLAARFPQQVFLMLLPRAEDPGSVKALASDLGRLEDWLSRRAGASPPEPTTAQGLFAPPTDYQPGGIFLVAGPLSDNGFLRFIADRGLPVSGVESCTSVERVHDLDDGIDPDSSVLDVARVVLSRVSCPRQGSTARRRRLAERLDLSQAKAVLYARLPFCDPAAYDGLTVAALASERKLPYLEVEVSYPFELPGPLKVRVEAFLETLLLAEGTEEDDLFADELFSRPAGESFPPGSTGA
jgi:hypothetical protein